MVAVIVGATGLVGSELVLKLLESSSITKVISMARRRLGIENSKLHEIVVRNIEEMGQHRADLKGDFYFCCLGTTMKTAGNKENFKKIDFEAIFDFGKIAKSHKAKSFSLVSASGANSRSPIFYSRTKGETELCLKELDFHRLVIWRPGLLMGDRHEFRLSEKILVSLFDKIGPRLPKKISRRFLSPVDHLAHRMLEQGLQTTPGTFTFEPQQI
jgi:uncharacterized protein YbjT (DUF2867 family)